MPHATHSNAALTPRARLRLARLIVEDDPGMDLEPYRPERLEGKLSMREQIF